MIGRYNLYSKQTDALAAVLLAGLAFCANGYLVGNLFGSINLYFGSTFVLFSILMLRTQYSLFVLLMSLLPIFLVGEQLVVIAEQIFEYCFISALLKFRIRFLTAITIFWSILGLPIFTAFIYFELLVSLQTSFFVACIISLSGYLSGFISLVCYWLLPTRYQRQGNNPVPPKFSSLVFELNTVSVILPVILVTLFFVWRLAETRDKALAYELDQATQEIGRSVKNLIDDKIHTLVSTAEILKNEKNTSNHSVILNSVADTSANIESMIVTDKHANVMLAAPQKYAERLPNLGNINISHRSYFNQTKKLRQPIVSRATKGQGLGDLDLVALTAPIIVDQVFEGLVQAAIGLDQLIDRNILNAIQNEDILILIADNKNSIIYNSEELQLQQLDKFVAKPEKYLLAQDRKATKVNNTTYIYQSHENERGWTIYTFVSPIKIFDGVGSYLLFLSSSLLLSILLIALLSKGLARKIAKPLLNLDRFISGEPAPSYKMVVESKVSRELESVTKSVIHYHKISEDFQKQLKSQVEDKTQKLQDLNASLLKLSQTDALTGLYNRGAFDSLALNTYQYCQRHKKSLSVSIFDIDLFKKINDQYGHVVGDECIKSVANLIASKLRRDTDILARYGGEEFILLYMTDESEPLEQCAQEIHRAIQRHTINVEEHTITMTLSGGVVNVMNDFSNDFTALISMADEQLYISKNSGRNQVNSITI